MSQQTIKHNAVIIDSDLDNRMRLRQATVSVSTFGHVRQFGSLHEAEVHLGNDPSPADVIFISHRFESDEAGRFVAKAKELKSTQDAAYIKVLPLPQQGSGEVAQQVAQGFDGFLVEPYSVNSLVEIVEIASRVKKERGEARAKIAVSLIVNDMVEQLDLVAFMKSAGYEIAKSWTKLKEMAGTLKSFSDSYLSVCMDTVVRLFSEAPLPKKAFQTKKYGGVSDRVKKRMEAKVISDAEKSRAPTTPQLIKKEQK